MMTGEYKKKLEQGHHYQDFVIEQLYDAGLPIISYSSKEYQFMIGENKAGLEIKNDTLFRKTGSFYIEVAEKSNAQNTSFVSSGIYRTDNTWLYLIGDEKEIFIFSKKHLILLHKTGRFAQKQIPTSRGYLLPVNYSREKAAIKIIIVNEKK